MDLFELATAVAERDAAIAGVTAHAVEGYSGWLREALTHVCVYASQHREFISEDCSDAAHAAGLLHAHDARAWGQVYRNAAKAGIIRKNGYGYSKKRASPTVRWESCHPNFAEAR